MSVRGSLALVLSVFGWPDRSSGWLDRSGFVDRWLSFFLSLVGRIGALGGWIDRSSRTSLASISLVGFDLVRGSGFVISLLGIVVFFDCFFFVLSLSPMCCVLCFFSLSLCVLQATEMN